MKPNRVEHYLLCAITGRGKEMSLLLALLLCMAAQSAWAESMSFITCGWDETKKEVTFSSEELRDGEFTQLAGNHSEDWLAFAAGGKYVVTESARYKVLNVMGENAHLYLCDGVTLNVKHIKLEKGKSLHIHAQSTGHEGVGRLIVNNDAYSGAAGIGGGDEADAGDLYIHGGHITATGNRTAASIGGGNEGAGGNLYVYDGTVTANESHLAASIGGGNKGNGGVVNIYGGSVTAHGQSYAAGIGPGYQAKFYGTVNILGGKVNASGVDGIRGIITIDHAIVIATTIIDTSDGAALSGELTIAPDFVYKVTKGTNGTSWRDTPVDFDEREYVCKRSGDHYSIKIEPCENHHYVDYACSYCNSEYYATATGTWWDEDIRASEFSHQDPDAKTITITREAELGLLTYNICHDTEVNGYEGYTITLADDLDMSAHKWDGDGTFKGTFDGQGHTISGLNYSKDRTGDAGLIAHNYGTVKNVVIANSVFVGNRYVGAVVGSNYGTVENCYVEADVSVVDSNNDSDSKGCGGIVGMQMQNPSTPDITPVTHGCYSKASVNGYYYLGGIIGSIGNNSQLEYCVSMATITRKTYSGKMGAVAGNVEEGATLLNNYYIAESEDKYANGTRLFEVKLSGDLQAGGHQLHYNGTVDKTYDICRLNFYSGQVTVGEDWYVPEGGTFRFMLGASTTDATCNYVMVNSNELTATDGEYTFSLTDGNTTTEFIIDAATWEGNGTKENPFLIQTTADWNDIRRVMNIVSANDLFEGKFFKQTAHIDIYQGIGVTGKPNDKTFCGIYDGDGHRLNCYLANPEENSYEAVAPFYKVKDATIMNLYVTGTITGGIHTAGLVAFVNGTVAIDNCRVSADIACTGNSENSAHGGGLVGHAQESTITVKNCLFDGILRATAHDNDGTRLGAIIGWAGTYTKVENCMEKGTYNTVGQTAFCWKNHDDASVSYPSYNRYLTDFSQVSGADKLYMVTSGTDGLEIVFPEGCYDWQEVYHGAMFKSLDDHAVAYLIGGQFYTVQSCDIQFDVEYKEKWWNVRLYNGEDEIKKYSGHYIFKQGPANTVITATFVPRWDGSGTAEDPWLLKSEDDFYCMKPYRDAGLQMIGKYFTVMAGTYNLAEDVQADSRLTISGEVSLNTGEGTTLTAPKGIELSEGNTLILGGSGRLHIKGCDDRKSGIGAYLVGTLIINSGTINVEGGRWGAALGGDEDNEKGGSITINGGVIEVGGGTYAAGIGGGDNVSGGRNGVCGDIVINGGQVKVSGGWVAGLNTPPAIGWGCQPYINDTGFNTGTITLGWTEETDYIEATSYTVQYSDAENNITFAKPFRIDGSSTVATVNNIGYRRIVPYTDAVIIYNNQNNATVISDNNGQEGDVVLYERALYMDGSWNTLCLPFDLTDSDTTNDIAFEGTVLEGATAMGYDHATLEAGTLELTFVPIYQAQAGTPILVKWDKDESYDELSDEYFEDYNICNPVFSGVTVHSDATTITTSEYADFVGSFSLVSLAANDMSVLYLGADNKLYYPKTDITIGSCRAYFQLKGITVGDLQNSVKSIVLDFGDGETDGIVSLTPNFSPMGEGSAYYTLDGRRLNGKPTQRGIYLRNGRKVIIKNSI